MPGYQRGGAVLARLRVFLQGSVPAYLLYIVVTLVLLLVWSALFVT